MKLFSLSIPLILLLFSSCASVTSDEKVVAPNVVLIVVDDLGWRDLGFMGSDYYETPNLDAFAKSGMVFTQAYAGASNCAPSRACLLSGQQTPRHGVYTVSPSARGKAETRKLIPTTNTKYLDNEQFTLPDLFQSAGYKTGSFGKWHVGEDPTQQGIEVNVGGNGRGHPGKDGYFSPYKVAHLSDGPDGEYLTDRLTTEAIGFLEQNKDQPFFLYMPYYTVHTPLMAKEALREKFAAKTASPGQSNPTYAGMVYSMDENVGRLLQTLDALNLTENTLVIFTSDNGGIRSVSSQEPLRAGKGSYYEGGIRVPMVWRWPGKIAAGSRCDTRVTNLDFFPTLQNILPTSPAPQQLDGHDIAPLLAGDTLAPRTLVWHFPIYLEAYDPENDDGRDPLFRTRPGTVLIDGDWKLHEYFEDGALELYNLREDVGERQNLVAQLPEKATELHQKMKIWREEMGAPVPTDLNPLYAGE